MKDLGTKGHTNSPLSPTFVQAEVWGGLKLSCGALIEVSSQGLVHCRDIHASGDEDGGSSQQRI